MPRSTPPAPTPRRLKKKLALAAILLLMAIVAAELAARFVFGLGDPPLMMSDPEIEYLAQPSKSYRRLGNSISYNQWSMRSDEFPAAKTNPSEFRLLVMGDSVVNGGVQTDQAKLATETIKRELAAQFDHPVAVGNIAAGSWGPPNLVAYIRKFGLFDADAIVIVISNHDATDAPTFEPLGVDSPQQKPVLALQEIVQRYLPRYLPTWLGGITAKPPRDDAKLQVDREVALNGLRELLATAQASGARVLVLQHWERSELDSGPQAGHADIAHIADDQKIERADLGPAFAESIKNGINPYRDIIHPNDEGQRIIARAILNWLNQNSSS